MDMYLYNCIHGMSPHLLKCLSLSLSVKHCKTDIYCTALYHPLFMFLSQGWISTSLPGPERSNATFGNGLKSVSLRWEQNMKNHNLGRDRWCVHLILVKLIFSGFHQYISGWIILNGDCSTYCFCAKASLIGPSEAAHEAHSCCTCLSGPRKFFASCARFPCSSGQCHQVQRLGHPSGNRKGMNDLI